MIDQLNRFRKRNSDHLDMKFFETRQWIIDGLIDIRRSGELRAVYCDDNRLAVIDNENIRQSITWIRALNMVEEFKERAAKQQTHLLVERKPPKRRTLPNEAKKKVCR